LKVEEFDMLRGERDLEDRLREGQDPPLQWIGCRGEKGFFGDHLMGDRTVGEEMGLFFCRVKMYFSLREDTEYCVFGLFFSKIY
jgi:hypothetical protein